MSTSLNTITNKNKPELKGVYKNISNLAILIQNQQKFVEWQIEFINKFIEQLKITQEDSLNDFLVKLENHMTMISKDKAESEGSQIANNKQSISEEIYYVPSILWRSDEVLCLSNSCLISPDFLQWVIKPYNLNTILSNAVDPDSEDDYVFQDVSNSRFVPTTFKTNINSKQTSSHRLADDNDLIKSFADLDNQNINFEQFLSLKNDD
ncbi:2954_t:CDS:2 [Funneliformis mosseae]|uniref:2954_t:CDS:1 n=1 Tax=Funneliformis mosseae TaxID=27381 RepID=A0A9N8WGY3_FUNMO|nr:2954_t:CDS:2 [Funneliformis mosseae]